MTKSDTATSGPSGSERRQGPRRTLLWRAILNCGEHEFDCLISDLSLKGAKLRFDLPLALESEILLNIVDLGAVAGKVAWTAEDSMGVEFVAPTENISRLLGTRAEPLGLA